MFKQKTIQVPLDHKARGLSPLERREEATKRLLSLSERGLLFKRVKAAALFFHSSGL